MKFLSVFAIFINTVLLFNNSYANNLTQDHVEKLINRHIQAVGGEDALINMQTISRYGQITFYEKNTVKDKFCYHTDIVYPKKLREQIKGKEIAYDRGTDGTNFWLWTGSQYEFTQDEKLKAYLRKTAEQANRDILWVKKASKNFHVVTNLPSWAPNNSQCIRGINADKIKSTYCFDTKTGLLNSFGGKDKYRVETDWRPVGNIKLPFHLTDYEDDQIAYEIQLDKAELDRVIPDTQFMKPDSPQLSCEY